jgi:hypothetical protein
MARGSESKFGLEPVIPKQLERVQVPSGTGGQLPKIQQGDIYKSNTASETGIGSGNNVIRQDTSQGFWIGHKDFSSAPFSVDMSGNLTATSATIGGYLLSSKGSFGGDGSDGVLNVTSGTTTLDAASANVLIKNYSSINISAGATLTISNKPNDGTILAIKCTGNVNIQGTIEMSGMGGNGGTTTLGGAQQGFGIIFDALGSVTGKNGAAVGTAGAAGAIISSKQAYSTTTTGESLLSIGKSILICCGSGGGAGANPTGADHTQGGAGGGGLIIECLGNLTLGASSSVKVNGVTGSAGITSSNGAGSGGGGGGSPGSVLLIYGGTLSNSSDPVAKWGGGGAGGNGAVGAGTNGGGGGGAGGSLDSAGGAGGAGGAVGVNGVSGNTVGGGGGGAGMGGATIGGAGTAVSGSITDHVTIIRNTMFA